ncbi:MAG: polysaccharide pyruvyl transferase CsaB [Desertifilum sp. SIO1I2]|nr:polysaccharide pyruvyl transferase CsaB [Desertifilum sp. SIO1I2]
MAQIRAVLCGYYGKGNGGDEALLATLLQMLPESVTPIVLSGNCSETRQRYGVQVGDRMSALRVFQALQRSDVLIWGGGSLIQDATSAISPLYYAGLMGMAQRLGLKTIAWAQGIGPLNRNFTRKIAKAAFAGCDAVSVRDRGSAQLLAEWQIPNVIAPDPVWALAGKPPKGVGDLPAPRVAVCLRPHPQLTPERLNTLIQALKLFQAATDTFLLLLPFQAASDLTIAQQIHSQISENSKIVSLTDPRELKGVFEGIEMAIAMRYHALIMAAGAKSQCFALSYDPKVSQLMAEYDIPGWELSQLPEAASDIAQTWIERYANPSAFDTPQIQAIIDRAKIHQELLHSVLS